MTYLRVDFLPLIFSALSGIKSSLVTCFLCFWPLNYGNGFIIPPTVLENLLNGRAGY